MPYTIECWNKKIRDWLNRLIEEKAVPGGCWSLIMSGRSMTGTAGWAQVEPEKVPMRRETLFDLASLTKVVGTIPGILICIQQGSLNLNTKIYDVLPDYRNHDLTVLDLLTHTSGLPADLENKHNLTPGNIRQAVLSVKPTAPRGEQIVYSDIGFLLLGFVLEKIHGDLRQFLKKEVFAPAGMSATSFLPADTGRCAATSWSEERGMICGEVNDTKAWLTGGVAGSAGLFSTIDDLTCFAEVLISDKNPVLDESSLLDLQKVWRRDGDDKRSLGWQIIEHGSETWLYHTGFTGTSMLLNIRKRNAFILLTNAIHPDRNKDAFVRERRQFIDQFIESES
ncbi:serine hydrolase domain-containing protein [Sporolactobacillus shoreae]|uniref:serine hydrolase domain-containing protein n=1 Tax=Sporolactobacillus shoreae TaxID=1465501 RepID=UPI0014331DB6|nr:serine hydrolase domain-containing protein [Sporolactobacillus shoreae]